MPVRLRLRNDTAAAWTSSNRVLGSGELGVETDTGRFKVGNGSSTWSDLAYANIPSDAIAFESIQKGGIPVGSGPGQLAVLSVGANGSILGVSLSDPTTLEWRQPPSLSQLSNVSLSSPQVNDLLRLSSAGGNWTNITLLQVLQDNQGLLRSLVWGASAGYFSKGAEGSTFNTIFKFAFPVDTPSTTTSAPANIRDNAGFSNPLVAGYFSGGNGTSSVYKWSFQGDAVSTTTAGLATMEYNAGFANPNVAGYFSRGSATDSVYRWTFPTDTVSSTTNATKTLSSHAGFANPSVAGYFSRGRFSALITFRDVYKWGFPTDTVSSTTLAPAEMGYNAGFSNPSVAGYFSRGGGNANEWPTVYKWSFPTDAVSTTTAAPEIMIYNAGFANPGVAGYFSRGGFEPTYATVYKWSFPGDTVSTLNESSSITPMSFNAGFANGY